MKNHIIESAKDTIKYLRDIQCRGYSHVLSDWIDLIIYSFTGNEEKYMEIVKRYSNKNQKGRREIDLFAEAHGRLMIEMDKRQIDVLGDIYMSFSWYDKGIGQFFTPHHICEFMAKIIMNPDIEGKIINDPTSGSGRFLITCGKINTNNFFIGQDIDPVCTKLTALNLLYYNLNGVAINGNTLRNEVCWGYKTKASYLGGEIREITANEIMILKKYLASSSKNQTTTSKTGISKKIPDQLELFDAIEYVTEKKNEKSA